MNITREANIFVGISTNKVNMEHLSDVDLDFFTDNYFIHVDSYVFETDIFIGVQLLCVEEDDEPLTIPNNLFDLKEEAKQTVIEILSEYDIDFDEDDIHLYLSCLCY